LALFRARIALDFQSIGTAMGPHHGHKKRKPAPKGRHFFRV
jgi:hypothetical protein